MIALLRYAILKGMRDRLLPILLLGSPILAAAALISLALSEGQLHYPLSVRLDSLGDPARLFALTFASLTAFWAFRSEVATRAINSFVMASRPVHIVVALILYGTVTGIAVWLGAIVTAAALTTELPVNLTWFAIETVIASLFGASIGALAVTISPQPTMLVWAICATLGLPVVLLFDAQRGELVFEVTTRARYLTSELVVSILCLGIGTFLLERRCAS